VKRGTPAQIARRQDAALRLWQEGYGVKQIAVALQTDASTIVEDLKTVYPERPRMRQKSANAIPTVDWRAEPAYSDPGEVMRAIQGFRGVLKSMNYRNQFAHSVTDAESDGKWYSSAEYEVACLEEIARELRHIIADPEYRRQVATTHSGRDDVRKHRMGEEELIELIVPLVRDEPDIRQRTLARRLNVSEDNTAFLKAVAVARYLVRKK